MALRDGRPEIVTIGWCTSLEATNAEVLARSGVDMVCVDGQHGVHGWADLLDVVHLLTAAGTTTLVRVPSLDPERIGHALDSGAHGVVVPRRPARATTRELAELGYRWFVLPSDIELMQSAARTPREELVGATVADPGPSELGAAGHRRISLDRRNGEQ
jgi:2-keto-3-deoxy-L-rhamnonate aldolase RhmA